MGLLIAFLSLALVVSFLCSMWESVLLSVTPSYVARAVSEGGRTGRLLSEFKRDIDRPLSAILTLNTIAHTVGAIGVGAQANKLFGTAGIELLDTRISYEAMIAGAATLAILVFSEIIPKTLGASYWRRFVPFTVISLKGLVFVLYPLVRMGEFITRFIKSKETHSVFSRADFAAMAELGAREGHLDSGEASVVRNVLRLRELRVADVMTPRTVVVAAPEYQSVRDFLARDDIGPFSRIPIYAENIDEVHGVVQKDAILAAAARDEHDRPVGSLAQPALFVLEHMHLPALMRILVNGRAKLAVVVGEYGITQGVVTFEDVVETLLGLEVVDETDAIADLQQFARNRAQGHAETAASHDG